MFQKGHPQFNNALETWRENGGIPWNKGKHYIHKKRPTPERCQKISQALKENKNALGYKHTEEAKKKIGDSHRGEKSVNWNPDRDAMKKNLRNDPEYQQWKKKVKKRDGNSCRFKSQKCSGYNIVHHILGWTKYPELRYNINNGITLCQYHHPRKRADEQRLIPILKHLVGSSEQ